MLRHITQKQGFFLLNNENIKQAIKKQITFTLSIKLERVHLLSKDDHFSANYAYIKYATT